MKNSFYGILMILVLVSCNKDQVLTKQDAGHVARIAAVSEFAIFGQVHNMGLDYMVDESSDLSSLSQESRFTLSRTFIYDDWMESSLFTSAEMIDTIEYVNKLYLNSSSVAHDLVIDGILSVDVETYMDRLNKVFEDVLDSSQQGIILTPDDVNLKISVIENDILLNNIQYDTSSTQGDWYACMLATMSVAKSSYFYWYTAAINTSSPWNFIVSGYGEKLPVPKWLKRAVNVVRVDYQIGVIAYSLHRGEDQSVLGSLGRSIRDGFSGSATYTKPSSK